MYPFLRLAYQFWDHRKAPPLGLLDTHVSHHRIWPWDLDPWMELNNGRTLTIYDLGRIVLFKRLGLRELNRDHGLGLTIAGSSVRYRKRVVAWDRLEIRSQVAGWDDRFVYIEQGMFRKGECTSHGLFRAAVVKNGKLFPAPEMAKLFGIDGAGPELPEWIKAWGEAEGQRPWPPMQT